MFHPVFVQFIYHAVFIVPVVCNSRNIDYSSSLSILEVLCSGSREGSKHVATSTEISSTVDCQELNLCEGLVRNFRKNYLTSCRRVLLVKAVKKFCTPPGTQSSLPCSQEPAACSYPKPHQSIPHPPILFHCSSWPFPSGFLHHTLSVFSLCSIRATCLTPLILRDLITITVFGEQCKSQGSSVCSLLQQRKSQGSSVCSLLQQRKSQGSSVYSLLQSPSSVTISSSAPCVRTVPPSTTGNTSSVLCNVHVLRQTGKTKDSGPNWSCTPCRRSDLSCFTH